MYTWEEEAAVAKSCTHSSMIYKHVYLHRQSTFKPGPEKGFAITHGASTPGRGRLFHSHGSETLDPLPAVLMSNNAHGFRTSSALYTCMYSGLTLVPTLE